MSVKQIMRSLPKLRPERIELMSLCEYEEQNAHTLDENSDPCELFQNKVTQLAWLLDISEEHAERILLGKDPLPA